MQVEQGPPAQGSHSSSEPTLNPTVFWGALSVLIIGTFTLLLDPEASLEAMGEVHHFLTLDMGWLFLGFVFFAVLWLGWLTISKHGQILLGTPGEPPAYSTISWLGMMFCTGIGSNLLYFGTTEWVGYYLSPPPLSGADPQTLAAADWAGAYSFFHWGISAWGVYALAAIPMAYVLHVKSATTLRVSTACAAGLKRLNLEALRHPIDILFIFGLVGGVGTSLGVGIPMLSAVASELFGFERGLGLDAGILVLMTIIFSYSVSAGLDKGIKLLSDVNVLLAIVLLVFIAAVGPTSFIINQGFDSLAIMFQNFVDMSLRMDAGGETSFAASNTVFFWAWWLAWAPFMGLFIARISRGRTIKEVVLGCIAGGSGACWVGFSILGHSVQNLVNQGQGAMTSIVQKAADGGGMDAPLMVVELLKQLPMNEVMLFVFFILSLIFVSTSLDSAAFTLAATASENLEADAQPARWHRLVWAFVLAGTALSLMFIGGLNVLQTASILVGFPLLFVMGFMVWTFSRELD